MAGTHSRTIEGKRHIWNVEDLWKLSKDLPVYDVDPESIINLDLDGWFKGKVPTPRDILDHMKRILNADLTKPVILDHDGTIMDGAHRTCRAILEDHSTIKAVRFEKTPGASQITDL